MRTDSAYEEKLNVLKDVIESVQLVVDEVGK